MILAANFKTNQTRESTSLYVEALNLFLDAYNTSCEVKVYPPLTALFNADSSPHVKIGAQNFYPAEKGAYTGEIGAEQLDEFNVKSVIVGHSERRMMLGETQDFVSKKFAFAKKCGWEVIYCIGEPLEVREKGFDSVMEYLLSEFENIDTKYDKLIVAYEPIWAIGTGKIAKKEEVDEVLRSLKKKLGKKVPVLYGGSVNTENFKHILAAKYCDGFLVGNASLDVSVFCELIKEAQKKIDKDAEKNKK